MGNSFFDGISINGENSDGQKKVQKKKEPQRQEGLQQRKTQTNNAHSYVGAPYNFVSFSKDVYHYPEGKLTKHNDMSKELISGEISYEIMSESPIFVGDGRKDSQGIELFHQNERGKYAIPGSTMRGLIRNNVQILGLSGIGDDVDDYALMYRAVAGGTEKERYGKVLGTRQINIGINKPVMLNALLNVRAGYLTEENGEYYIRAAKKHPLGNGQYSMNYYILSEKQILENQKNYPFFTADPEKRMMYTLNCTFNRIERKGKVQYLPKDKKTMENKEYKPYYEKISYETNGNRVTKVGERGRYNQEGYVLSSGYMNGKKAVYIIPEIEKDKEKEEQIDIPAKDINAFRIDLAKRENTLKRFGGRKFFDLPDVGKTKPVFYIYLNGKLYFGFTPRLRLFYDYTIRQGMSEKHKMDKVDYAKAMFGYAKKEKAYKSKVSFSDAVVQEQNNTLENETKQLILLEPKPTSYMDYVKPEGKYRTPVTYNKEKFELRGIKQYWLHKKIVDTNNIDSKLIKVVTKFHPIKAGIKFAGKVRFQNLTADEFGLLLWSIRLNEHSQMNVGKGKPYGYGKVSVNLKEVKVMDFQLAYNVSEPFSFSPFKVLTVKEIEEYIGKYKKAINTFLSKNTIDELPHIQEFFMIKDARLIPDNDKTKYMSLENKDYQNRIRNKQVLDTISQVAGVE